MKYEVFARQLEAHVGQSSVRGGRAIKTDRKASYNLNQLLSRVKTIFSHKAHNEEKPEPTVQVTQKSDQNLRNALADVEKYLANNFGTATSALTYEEYTNGISLTSDAPTFSTAVVILTRTNGMLNLPDNVILLGYVVGEIERAIGAGQNDNCC